jgi:hypothetical protein
MLPYQPNSDALLAPAVPTVPVDPFCLLELGRAESLFARVVLSFLSDLVLALSGLDLGFVTGFEEAFVTTVFLGVGFGIGFGVGFSLDTGLGLGFAAVSVGVGLGVADGISISLFAILATGFSSAISFCSDWLDSR